MKSEVIVCIVERGKADAVVKKAVAAGAGGATIFYGRGAGENTFSFFHSLNVDSSKEIILILATEAGKAAIIDAIVMEARLEEHGRGILFTLPAGDVRGIKVPPAKT